MREATDERRWIVKTGGPDGKLIAVGGFKANDGPILTMFGGHGDDGAYIEGLFVDRLTEMVLLETVVSPIVGEDVPFDRLNPRHAGVAFDAIAGVRLLSGHRTHVEAIPARDVAPDDDDLLPTRREGTE